MRHEDPAPQEWAAELGVSQEAVALYLAAEVVDLHIDSFIWTRALGYDLGRRHDLGPLGGRLFSQLDLPRARDARLGGGVWSITTNPLRGARGRRRAFFENLAQLEGVFAEAGSGFEAVRDLAGYRRARAAGRQAALIGVQGGHALDADLEDLGRIPQVIRVTVMGASHSSLGVSSETVPRWWPRPGHSGLTARGAAFVEALDAHRIFVDLAHADRRTFFDAVAVHDPGLPLMISHTAAAALLPLARNMEDDQLRAVAESGGVVGILFKSGVVSRGRATSADVARHLRHVVDTVGEDHAALGADWDGVMTPPSDLLTPRHLPRLVQRLLDMGWGADRILKILGGNVLRALGQLRGEG